ncbi:MAG TPA: hypothetical protein VN374_00700 [Desulfitobacteriaceae bacterium]|nr:hypothetical protein [Desulfitobacteriaceae bacterium]
MIEFVAITTTEGAFSISVLEHQVITAGVARFHAETFHLFQKHFQLCAEELAAVARLQDLG